LFVVIIIIANIYIVNKDFHLLPLNGMRSMD